MFMDNAKLKIDDNFAKKLETDTLTKAISKLGFNADIFMGKFDDVKYLAEVTKEFASNEPKEVPTMNNAQHKKLIDTATAERLEEVLNAIEEGKLDANPGQVLTLEEKLIELKTV